ncbi:hypothetical protein OQA88_12589 [Cercophora sp. LCS_1]
MEVIHLADKLWRLDTVLVLVCVYIFHVTAHKLYQLFIYPYYVSPLRHLPGPKDHHFLIGQVLNQFRGGSPNEPFVSWMRRWPRAPLIRFFDVGNLDALLVTGLAAHKEILGDKAYSFQKPPFFIRLVGDVIGYGLGLAEGDDHKKQRKTLGLLFSPSNLKELIPLLRRKAQRLSSHFERIIDTEDGVAEVISLYSNITLEIMAVFALGVELDDIEYSDAFDTSFHDCYTELFEPDRFGQVLMALNTVVPIRWLPVPANWRFKHANMMIRRQISSIMKDRIQAVAASKAAGTTNNSETIKDFLTFMISEKYFSEPDRWSEDDILAQILTFLAAGHQTTADALVWATQMMIEHPDETKRLRAEINGLLSQKPFTELQQRDVESLPFLNNFMREVLRVHCPGVNVARQASEDVVVQGVRIPKGTTVVMQPVIIQRNPTIWGQDCDEFRPDRWEHLEGEAADPWAFAAFSHGPRVCIGKAMTVLEFKLIMIELVTKFEFEGMDDRKAHDIRLINPSPMYRPDGGLRVRVRRTQE